MGIFEFLGVNFEATAATDSRASDFVGGPLDFAEISNESAPNGETTSDSSGSDSSRNLNSSHEFRMPFRDSDNSNTTSSSESEAKISLSEAEKRQSRSDDSGESSSSSRSGSSPKSKLMYDAWQNRGPSSSPDRSTIGTASSGQASTRSSGSSSTESDVRGPPPSASYDHGDNSTAAGIASLQTTDTYGWPVQPNDTSLDLVHPTAKRLSDQLLPRKSTNSNAPTPPRGNHQSSSSSEEESGRGSVKQGSTSRVQPNKIGKTTGSKGSKGERSEKSKSKSEQSSDSDDSSVPAGPIPLETSFEPGEVTDESFSSVSSSSSDESGSGSESSSSHDDSKRSKEESSQKSRRKSSSDRSQESKEKQESSNPLKRMEERRQESLSASEGGSSASRNNKNENAKQTSSRRSSESSSSESRYEMKSDASLLKKSANSLDPNAKRSEDNSEASKSSGSSSEESALVPPLGPPTIEKLKGGYSSSSRSAYSSSSSSSPSSKESGSEKSQSKKSDRRSSGSSSSSGTRSKSSRSASPKPKPRGKKRDSNFSGTESSMESFGSSSSSENSKKLMKSFGYMPPDAQVFSSDQGSSGSSKRAGSKISDSKDSPKPQIEKPKDKSSGSSKSSGSDLKESAFGPASPKSQGEKAIDESRIDAKDEENNFALDKKLLLESSSSSSDSDVPASKAIPRPWSDFVPSPKTNPELRPTEDGSDPEFKRTDDAVARSEHDSDEFQWVPSDKNGWMPPVRAIPPIRSIPARDARKMERQSVLPAVESNEKYDFLPPKEKYKPDPPLGKASNKNTLESMEMPLFYANILATGTHRQTLQNAVGNVPPVPPMDMKMRHKEYHGVPPVSEIAVFPKGDDESTLGTEGFHYAPFMMGESREFNPKPQYSSPNIRQLNPWPEVRMSEVLRSDVTDPPEVMKTNRSSSYLQFINKSTLTQPTAKPQGTKKEEKTNPSYSMNANFGKRQEESENSWVPTQLKSELISVRGVGPIQLTPPKEDSTLDDPKDLLYNQSTKPHSVKSSSAASNWNPTEISESQRNAPPNTMAAPSVSFRSERRTDATTMDEDEESVEEEVVEDDGTSVYDEVTVASEQNSRPASQMSEPKSDESSSSSGSYHPTGILDSSSSSSSSGSYHPTGILDSSSESSSESLRPPVNQSRPPAVPPNQRKPPIVTPYQRNEANNRTSDLEDQRQPLNGGQKSKRPTALLYSVIALFCLLLVIGGGVVAYFLTREDGPAPVVSSVNPPTNRPTPSVPTQAPSLSPTLASQTPSISPSRSPTRAPTRPPGDPEVREDDYYKLIVSAYPQGGDAIENRSSPQRSAFEWLRSISNVQDLPDKRVLQRYALATLFYSTRGWEWSQASRWLSNEHECSWFSTSAALDVCDPNRDLTVLSLRENNLDGSIPAEIFALLPLLEEVQLHGNELDGSIPTEVSNLSRLALFDLSSNQIFSNLPSQLGGISRLKRIALANNKIFSTIPTELGRLSSLETLDLGANQLTGTIPTAMTSMTNLAGLSLYANYISGTVPRNFSSLSNLQLIYIDGNYLSGSVSNSLCQLQVREFWADCDRLVCSCCTTCCTAQGCGN